MKRWLGYPSLVLRAPSVDSFLVQPIDRWVEIGPTIAWCKRPSLGGAVSWGRSDLAVARDLVRAFESVFGPMMAPQVDIVLDGSRIDGIDADALAYLLGWIDRERERIHGRIRLQVGVIGEGILGVTLAGILPTLGGVHPFVVERGALAALSRLAPGEGDSIHAEIEAAVLSVSGIDPVVRRLSEWLTAHGLAVTVDEAAKGLGLSTRSLQRQLRSADTSFLDELRRARVREAARLLRETRDKVSAIATRIGISETTLHEIVRDELGTTPAKIREQR